MLAFATGVPTCALALVLTIVIAMLQVGNPVGNPYSLVSQWYTIFTLAAVMFKSVGSFVSSLLMSYLSPLE